MSRKVVGHRVDGVSVYGHGTGQSAVRFGIHGATCTSA
jgi:hypothetical protein